MHDRVAEQNGPLMDYYKAMAKIDPTSASFDPPPHVFMPMPRGGLTVIARNHLGRPPTEPPYDANQQERQAYAEKKAAYDKDLEYYTHLLYRFNADTLRTDDHYTMGAPVRVFTEGLL